MNPDEYEKRLKHRAYLIMKLFWKDFTEDQLKIYVERLRKWDENTLKMKESK